MKVPRGSMVHLLLGSANRDPSVFSAPERFDAGRSTQGSLATVARSARATPSAGAFGPVERAIPSAVRINTGE
jgi:cytochrome P450